MGNNPLVIQAEEYIRTTILSKLNTYTITDILPLAVAQAMGKIIFREGATPSLDREWKQYFTDVVLDGIDLDKVKSNVNFVDLMEELHQEIIMTAGDLMESWFFLSGHEQRMMLSHYCDEDCEERHCVIEDHNCGDEYDDCEFSCPLAEAAIEIPCDDTLGMDGIFSIPTLQKIPHPHVPTFEEMRWIFPAGRHGPASYVGIVEHRIFDLIKRTTPNEFLRGAGDSSALLSRLGWDTILCGDMEIAHMSHCPEGQLIGYRKDAVSFVVNDESENVWRWTGLHSASNRNRWRGQFLTIASWLFEDPDSCFVVTDIPRHP